MDQRQRGLALGEIVAEVLAQRVGIARVVEHVVGDLERVAELHPVVVQRLLRGFVRAGGQRAEPGAGGEQHRGLALDDVEIRRLVGIRIAHVQQLQHFAFGDAVGGVGEDAHHRHAVEFDHQLEAARIQEIADQHAGRIAPDRIRRAAAAAQVGLVDHVVVQQRGGVDELDDRRQLVVVGTDRAGGAAGQHHQHRPQALAAGRDDVLGHLVDQHHVRRQPSTDQRVDGGHVAGGEGLDRRQVEPGGRGGGVVHAGSGTGRPGIIGKARRPRAVASERRVRNGRTAEGGRLIL